MSKRSRQFVCENNPNEFCNVCGEFMVLKNVRRFTDALKKIYSNYFGVQPNLTDEWAPKSLCASCQTTLSKWATDKRYAIRC